MEVRGSIHTWCWVSNEDLFSQHAGHTCKLGASSLRAGCPLLYSFLELRRTEPAKMCGCGVPPSFPLAPRLEWATTFSFHSCNLFHFPPKGGARRFRCTHPARHLKPRVGIFKASLPRKVTPPAPPFEPLRFLPRGGRSRNGHIGPFNPLFRWTL